MTKMAVVSLLLGMSLAFAGSPAHAAGLVEAEQNLKNIETRLSGIETRKTVSDTDFDALERAMDQYAKALKAAFDAANLDAKKAVESEGKLGTVKTLEDFENGASANESRVNAIQARLKNIEARIKTAEIKLDKPMLQKMTQPERQEFERFLTPSGRESYKKLHPDLFKGGPTSSLNPLDEIPVARTLQEVCSSLSVLPEQLSSFLVSPAEASVAKPCWAPCKAKNWSACGACILTAGPQAVAAYSTFNSCWSNCGSLKKWLRAGCRAVCLATFVQKVF